MTTYTRNTLSGSLAPVNNELEKIEVSLREKLDRNPSVAQNNEMLDDLDMNSNRIINYPDAVNDSDLITKGQVASLAPVQSVDGQTGNVVSPVQTVNGQTGNVSIPTQIQIDNGVVFDNISEMKSSSLEIGQLVKCKRYYALGELVDGLEFEVVSSGTGVDDGGSFHDLANGNQVQLVISTKINTKHFGAVGNWDSETQTGTDDSSAFQAYINFMASQPSKRKGGTRAIFLGNGQFKISSVILPAAFEFGIDIFGNGRDATCIWSDPSDTNPTILSEIEFVTFRNMTLFGSLSEAGNVTVKKDCFYRGKLPSNRTDIDVKFINCHSGYATNFVEAYGRGVTFEGGSAIYCINLLNIVCSADTVFSGTANDSVQTGMRNYRFSNLRTDVVSRVVKITGTAAQKDYINGPQITGCEFTVTDRLIDSDDGRIINPLISNNASVSSFAGGVVTVSSIVGCQDIGNSWKNTYNNDTNPASNSEEILWLYNTTGAINGLTIEGTLARGLRDGVVNAGGGSNDIKIINNQFPNAFTVSGNANRFVFFSTGNCESLTIDQNSFTSSVTNLSYRLFNGAVQTDKNTIIGVNPAPWSWVDGRLTYVPKLLVGGVATAGSATVQGRYKVDSNYVHVEAEIIVDPTETSGNLSVSLPSITAIAEAPTLTSGYSGGGAVNRLTGFTGTGFSVAPVQVNPVSQEAELYVAQNLTLARLTAAESSGTVAIFVSFKYRYQ